MKTTSWIVGPVVGALCISLAVGCGGGTPPGDTGGLGGGAGSIPRTCAERAALDSRLICIDGFNGEDQVHLRLPVSASKVFKAGPGEGVQVKLEVDYAGSYVLGLERDPGCADHSVDLATDEAMTQAVEGLQARNTLGAYESLLRQRLEKGETYHLRAVNPASCPPITDGVIFVSRVSDGSLAHPLPVKLGSAFLGTLGRSQAFGAANGEAYLSFTAPPSGKVKVQLTFNRLLTGNNGTTVDVSAWRDGLGPNQGGTLLASATATSGETQQLSLAELEEGKTYFLYLFNNAALVSSGTELATGQPYSVSVSEVP